MVPTLYINVEKLKLFTCKGWRKYLICNTSHISIVYSENKGYEYLANCLKVK